MKRFSALILTFVLLIYGLIPPIPVEAAKSKSVSGADVIAYAKSFVGNKYVWGGNSLTGGIDCSHFVYQIYHNFDKDFGYVTSGSYISHSRCSKVSGITKESEVKDKAQAGDIVVWDGHVAIACGDGKIVHAQSSKTGICVTDVSSGHTFKGVVRPNILSADASASDTSGGNKASDAEIKAAQKALGLSDAQVKKFKAGWDACITSGWTPAAIAGAYGNFKVECGFNPALKESGGDGIGLAQWTTSDEHNKLVAWSKKCGHKTQRVGSWNICVDVGCQMAFMLTDMKSRWGKKYHMNYNEYVKDFKNVKKGEHGIKNGDPADLHYDIDLCETADAFTKSSKAWDAAIAYHDCYEVSAGTNYLIHREMDRVKAYNRTDADFFVQAHTMRPKYAEQALILFSGTKDGSGTSNNSIEADKNTAETVATQLVASGVWTDAQLSSYCKLQQLNVDDILKAATLGGMNQKDRTSLENWRRNIDSDKWDIIKVLRIITIFIGIALIIWSVLLYVAFWFDRSNNIIDFSLLGVLSGNKLYTSYSDDEANFNPSVSDGGRRTVSHKQILIISIIGVAVGTMVISGLLYVFIQNLVNFITSFIG